MPMPLTRLCEYNSSSQFYRGGTVVKIDPRLIKRPDLSSCNFRSSQASVIELYLIYYGKKLVTGNFLENNSMDWSILVDT